MAIADMNRFTLLTFHAHKQALLKALQVFGDVHFKTLGQKELAEMRFLRPDFSPEQLARYEIELEKARFAASKLAPFLDKPKMTDKRETLTFEEFDRYAAEYDYNTVYERVKEQDEAIAGCRSEIARRLAENDNLAAWEKLDVSPADLDALTETGYLLGTVNKQVADEFTARAGAQFDDVYVELLDTRGDDIALLLLFPAGRGNDVFAFARELGFTKAVFQLNGMPKEVIRENGEEAEALRGRIDKANEALRAMTPEHGKLQVALDYFATVLEREKSTQNFLQSDTVVLIEGWVPAEDGGRLREILESACGGEYYIEEQPVERDNAEVPIKLKNNRFSGLFESITGMYSMPRYNEADPTPILAPFYWLFFGLMVGDIGYGLVIFLGTTLALRLLDFKEGMRSFMKFFRCLSVSVTLAGVVYGGIFGVTVIKPVYDPSLGEYKAILDSQLDITTMLIISIAIGIVHIAVGLLTKTFVCVRQGDPASGIFDGLFWLIAVLAGIGWLLGFILGAEAFWRACRMVFFASLVGLAATQGRSSPSIAGKIGNGLYGVYGITSYVGDIVSYTRIVALGLSGAYIAYAFNLMTQLIVGDFSGNIAVSLIRLVFGIIVVVFGQTLNLGLAMLGGYVHSCRLQYVEFFSKFYDGGGVPFRPLTLKNQYIHIKK